MRNHNRPAAVMLAAVVFSAHMALAADAAEPAEPKPSISLSATDAPSGGTVGVIADFKLDPTVHLYKDKIRFEWTKLEGATFAGAVLPKPLRIPDPLADDKTQMIEIYKGRVQVLGRLTVTAKPGEPIAVEGKLLHQSCTDQICFPPAEEAFGFKLVAGAAIGPVNTIPAKASSDDAGDGGRSLWAQLVVAFLGGIALALTPCVYPMIPITAAVIGARNEKGIASALAASFVYVLGLAIVYALLGLLIAKLGSTVSSFLQTAWVLVPVAGIFVALAVVMFAGINFGAPTGVAAKLQGLLAGKKGVAATFALGAVSGLIAGPCIAAPLAGLLLHIARTGNLFLGFWMLFVLAWGMGVPLILFGTATGLMPKAGPWMEWIKRLLGFVLLWAAAYFLQTVIGETAYQLVVGALLLVAAVFLGGLDALTKESSFADRLKRLFGVAAVIAGVALLVPPVARLTGFSPSGPASVPAENVFKPATQKDVEAAIAAGKPVVLDFYADWCTICKTLDKKVYTKPETAEAAKGLAMLKIDVDGEPGLAKKYDVFRPPVAVFIEPDGTVRKDLGFSGMKTVDELVELLKKFKQK